ncbi:Protein of unknown function [Gryllus bimaculatus]|nr:Protein of unknown function [Gryllus bimaculatus]
MGGVGMGERALAETESDARCGGRRRRVQGRETHVPRARARRRSLRSSAPNATAAAASATLLHGCGRRESRVLDFIVGMTTFFPPVGGLLPPPFPTLPIRFNHYPHRLSLSAFPSPPPPTEEGRGGGAGRRSAAMLAPDGANRLVVVVGRVHIKIASSGEGEVCEEEPPQAPQPTAAAAAEAFPSAAARTKDCGARPSEGPRLLLLLCRLLWKLSNNLWSIWNMGCQPKRRWLMLRDRQPSTGSRGNTAKLYTRCGMAQTTRS